MASQGVGRKANQLGTTLGELGLKLGEGAELGGADRGVVLGVGEEDDPVVTDELMEVDRAVGGVGLEVGGNSAQTETRCLSVMAFPISISCSYVSILYLLPRPATPPFLYLPPVFGEMTKQKKGHGYLRFSLISHVECGKREEITIRVSVQVLSYMPIGEDGVGDVIDVVSKEKKRKKRGRGGETCALGVQPGL